MKARYKTVRLVLPLPIPTLSRLKRSELSATVYHLQHYSYVSTMHMRAFDTGFVLTMSKVSSSNDNQSNQGPGRPYSKDHSGRKKGLRQEQLSNL